MSNYTHLNNIAVQGSIESSAQGKLIGSFDTMPAASPLNAGQIVLYTGATGTYVQGKYYVSNGTSWVISAASPSAVTVDSALSDTSTNPVQNKVIKAALDAKVPVVSGKGLSTNDYTTAEKTKLSGIEAGAQVNKVTDVTVNGTTVVGADKVAAIDLSNYATKGDVSAIPKFAISVVTELPTSGISTSTIYLKSNGGSSGNSYDEYLYVNGAWEKIGTTEVDLSGYVPKTTTVNNKQLNTNITLTAGDVGALPAGGTAAKATADANGNNIANTYATQTALTNGLAAKQNALTFDSAPTSGSSNPVTSGGVFSAINRKQDTLTFDSTPTSGSQNPVTSDGIYKAIDGIDVGLPATGSATQPIYINSSGQPAVCSYSIGTAASYGVTTSVTSGSSSLVTSGAVYTAINNIAPGYTFRVTINCPDEWTIFEPYKHIYSGSTTHWYGDNVKITRSDKSNYAASLVSKANTDINAYCTGNCTYSISDGSTTTSSLNYITLSTYDDSDNNGLYKVYNIFKEGLVNIETNYPGKIRVNLKINTLSEIVFWDGSKRYFVYPGSLVFDVQSNGEGGYILSISSFNLARIYLKTESSYKPDTIRVKFGIYVDSITIPS